MIHCFTSAVFCVDVCCVLLPLCAICHGCYFKGTLSALGGAPVAAVRTVVVLAVGATGAQGGLLLLLALRAHAGVWAPPTSAAAHHTAPLATPGPLVALRPSAPHGGARAYRCRVDQRGGRWPAHQRVHDPRPEWDTTLMCEFRTKYTIVLDLFRYITFVYIFCLQPAVPPRDVVTYY